MNKVEGKVGDFCLNCKNCKAVTRVHDGETASIRIIEVECVDPYDGMVKILDADSDICCSMFEPKPACEKCERFDGMYCHSPEGIFVTSYMATGNCSFYSEKKEKEPCDEISCLQHELEMDKLRSKIHELEKEKAAHLKGIERLKKSQEKLQNQVKNLQTTNEESYKREEKLEEKVHKLERRLLDENKRFSRLDSEFLIPLSRVLYPGEAKICKPYSEVLKDIKLLNKGVYDLEEDCKRLADKNKALFEENIDRLDKHTKQCQEIDNLKNELKKANKLADSWKRDYERLRDQFVHPIYNILYPDKLDLDINVTDVINDVKDLKIYEDENKSMYEDLKYWRERCHGAETDVTTLNSKVEVLENRYNQLKEKNDKDVMHSLHLGYELNKMKSRYETECKSSSNIVEENVKLETEINNLKEKIENLKKMVETLKNKNTKLKQTISDQEITIKALLITIKEMCKDE